MFVLVVVVGDGGGGDGAGGSNGDGAMHVLLLLLFLWWLLLPLLLLWLVVQSWIGLRAQGALDQRRRCARLEQLGKPCALVLPIGSMSSMWQV